MTASNKNEPPLDDQNEHANPTVELDLTMPYAGETQPEEAVSTEGEDNSPGDEDVDASGDDAKTVDDPDAGEDFRPAPMRAGEFFVPLSQLCEWQHHPRRGSRYFGAHEKPLLLSATDPLSLRPIVVLPAVEGVYPIVDGRFIWAAVREANQGNEDVEVRCILFDGTEQEAVAAMCDTLLGTIGASAIEQAQALLSLSLTNGISRTAIANRYPGLTVSKVSNMLIAAETKAAYPMLFDILHEPDRAPVSYGVELNKVRKAMGAAFQEVLDRAADLAANGDRCKPVDAFSFLQIERFVDPDDPAHAAPKLKPIVPIESELILGHDDQPVAAYERLADNIDRIRLPDVAGMSLAEREIAAEACIGQVLRHFGLDERG
jgi:hypothetical protein